MARHLIRSVVAVILLYVVGIVVYHAAGQWALLVHGDPGAAVYTATFSPDGRRVLTAS